jgi:hypothetical protein
MGKVLNLRPSHGKIIALLGSEYEQMYRICYGSELRATGESWHGKAEEERGC